VVWERRFAAMPRRGALSHTRHKESTRNDTGGGVRLLLDLLLVYIHRVLMPDRIGRSASVRLPTEMKGAVLGWRRRWMLLKKVEFDDHRPKWKMVSRLER